MKYCTQCGKPLQDDAGFCTACGAKLTPAPAFAAPPPAYMPPPAAPAAPRLTGRTHFRSTGMGFIPPAALLMIALVIGMGSSRFLADGNLINIFRQGAVYAAIAFAAVLSARAKGPDLSVGSVAALSGIIIGLVLQAGGAWFTGLLLAILAAAVIGAVNGVVNAVIRVRSIPLTVLISAVVTGTVSSIVRQIARLAGPFYITVDPPAISPVTAAFLLLLVSLALAFFLNFGTKLGAPIYQTGRSVGLCIAAYVASAVIAALAGCYLAIRLRAATPNAATGNEVFILFVFACVISSRALDNRFAPVVYALFPALSWTLLSNAFVLNNIMDYYLSILCWLLTAGALLIAFFSRYEKKARGHGLPL